MVFTRASHRMSAVQAMTEVIRIVQSSAPNREQFAKLQSLFAEFDRSDAPGLAVGVRQGEGFLYRRAFGLASVQHGLANTPATRFRFASVTKQFTCLALMLLAEEGKVDIDAPASIFIPGLQKGPGSASLRHFMNHTSGIRCTLELGSIANGFAFQPATWQAQALARQEGLQYNPGSEQLYCNGTFAALTDVIETLSGESYPAFLRRRVFEPLSMLDTEIVENDLTMVPGLASAHVRKEGHWERPPVDAPVRGDGGIVSTIDDMLRWLEHLRGAKRVGSEAAWSQMLAPAVLQGGFRTTYAMGIKRHAYRGMEVLQHSGGLFGLNAQIITVPEAALDVVIAVNGANASATRLAFSVLDCCLEGLPESGPGRARSEDYPYLLGRHFTHPSGLLLSFSDMAGALGLAQMDMWPAPVVYEDEATLHVLFEEIGFGPLVWQKADLRNFADHPASDLPVTIAGRHHVLTPLEAPSGTAAAWSNGKAGIYRSSELRAALEVSNPEKGPVVAIRGDYSGRREFSVHVLSDRHAGIESLDGSERYAIEFTAGPDGKATGLWIDTHRARRVWFGRSPAQEVL